MAIKPKDEYPGQVITTDANYPHGKARNVSVPGDGTGTPWEAKLLNDIFGFQQATLAAAGVSPSGVPDDVAASDYLTALKALTRRTIAVFDISGSLTGGDVPTGDYFTLETELASSSPTDYIVEDNAGVPADPGYRIKSLQTSNPIHLVAFTVKVGLDSVANPAIASVLLDAVSDSALFLNTRFSASNHNVPVSGIWATTLSASGAKRLRLKNQSGFDLLSPSGKLVVVRVGGMVAGW